MLCDLKTFTRWLRHLEMLPSKRLHHAFKRSKENVLWTFRKCLHDWKLPSSKRLHLNFTSYDLKSSTICLYDFAMEGPQNVFIIDVLKTFSTGLWNIWSCNFTHSVKYWIRLEHDFKYAALQRTSWRLVCVSAGAPPMLCLAEMAHAKGCMRRLHSTS